MTALALAALMLVMSIQSSLDIKIIPEPVVQITQVGNVRIETERRGWTVCTTTWHPNGAVTGHVDSLTAIPYGDTFEHELLHAADCSDDGQTNGSLLPYAATWKDASHEWVAFALENPEQAIEIMKNVQGGR